MALRLAEAARHEAVLSALVNQAYGLTPEDERLLWATAPPRMPVPPPAIPAASSRGIDSGLQPPVPVD